MLVLPDFEWVQPRTVPEAVAALAGPPGETLLMAGGTDLLPNLKHGLHAPRRLVSLRRIETLRQVEETEGRGLLLGAGVTLSELSRHAIVRARYPALARAAGLVAGPQLRNMGTLGGNLCLDTRCVFYNQTRFWREALGYCLKKDGHACHVVSGGRRCVAAFSADTPGPLIAYRATAHIASPRGDRIIPVSEFFHGDGIHNTVIRPDEILTGVSLPAPRRGLHGGYEKLRPRNAIDFPFLSVAVTAALENGGVVRSMTVVVGGLGAKPRIVGRVESAVRGRPLDDALKEEVGELAGKQCHPLPNLNVDPEWRGRVLPVYVRRALDGLQASA